jgi:hypothetical protein
MRDISYDYLEKIRDILLEEGHSIGSLRYHVATFGCQMNARDSEKLRGMLEYAGFSESPDEDCDIVIYNTCTVRENANQKVYGRLGELKGIKKKNPFMKIVLCGVFHVGILLAKNGENLFWVLYELFYEVGAGLPSYDDRGDDTWKQNQVASCQNGSHTFRLMVEKGGNVSLVVGNHLNGCI